MDRDMKKVLEVLQEQQKTLSKLETSMKMLSEASLSFATNQQTVNKSLFLFKSPCDLCPKMC